MKDNLDIIGEIRKFNFVLLYTPHELKVHIIDRLASKGKLVFIPRLRTWEEYQEFLTTIKVHRNKTIVVDDFLLYDKDNVEEGTHMTRGKMMSEMIRRIPAALKVNNVRLIGLVSSYHDFANRPWSTAGAPKMESPITDFMTDFIAYVGEDYVMPLRWKVGPSGKRIRIAHLLGDVWNYLEDGIYPDEGQHVIVWDERDNVYHGKGDDEGRIHIGDAVYSNEDDKHTWSGQGPCTFTQVVAWMPTPKKPSRLIKGDK